MSQLTLHPPVQLISSVDPKFLNLTKVDDRIYEEFRRTFRDLRVDVLDPEELKSEPAKAVGGGLGGDLSGIFPPFSRYFGGAEGVFIPPPSPRSGARSASASRAWWRISTTGRCSGWIPAGNTRRKTPSSVGNGVRELLGGDPKSTDFPGVHPFPAFSATRIQFFAIEIARNREGWNDEVYSSAREPAASEGKSG